MITDEFPLIRHPNKGATSPKCDNASDANPFPLIRHLNKGAT
ncbi:hypothetical protein PL9214670165 [Planktothrix tepida PCC 9214]|uniref:Uncharacterized protein n=1 Tax=Planktothrix tepida PCC 9214 TaxID=671072 RepID=A0A1J1LSF8_9CYAN|nr:hypothetical protein PL9214670165 [Planktothrix tepida PCC 9214]